ncbi:MAG: GNAT family N-acetyltransferase [Candidatus Dactylopiibacterium sp.]|nr:GNAT family N-acetyltransferase [Candidatus Dactylopiibacterium sp.]
MLPEGVRIVAPVSAQEAGEAALQLVASGRGSLQRVLGNAAQRVALFGPALRWSHVLLAMHDQQALGFIAFKRHGVGPYAPTREDFRRVFGAAGGLWRWLAFVCIERRDRKSAFYIYGLKVVVRARRQGLAAALLDAALARARDAGATQAELELRVGNEAARRLYASRRFEPCGEVELGLAGRLLSFRRLLRMRVIL